MTVLLLVALGAAISTLVAAWGKCPIWVPVMLLCIFALLQVLPLGLTR